MRPGVSVGSTGCRRRRSTTTGDTVSPLEFQRWRPYLRGRIVTSTASTIISFAAAAAVIARRPRGGTHHATLLRELSTAVTNRRGIAASAGAATGVGTASVAIGAFHRRNLFALAKVFESLQGFRLRRHRNELEWDRNGWEEGKCGKGIFSHEAFIIQTQINDLGFIKFKNQDEVQAKKLTSLSAMGKTKVKSFPIA